jgi:GNAT superfamily N-acetyltransferase
MISRRGDRTADLAASMKRSARTSKMSGRMVKGDRRRYGYGLRSPRTFESVTALLAELGRQPVSDRTRRRFQAVYRRQLEDSSTFHVVAEWEGRVAGFCSLHIRDRLNCERPEAWIPDLIGDPKARRLGVGRALLDSAIQRARAAGCIQLALESGHARKEAHGLYRSMRMAEGLAFVLSLYPEK